MSIKCHSTSDSVTGDAVLKLHYEQNTYGNCFFTLNCRLADSALHPAFLMVKLGIFSLGGESAAYVPFLLVDLKDLLYLRIQR